MSWLIVVCLSNVYSGSRRTSGKCHQNHFKMIHFDLVKWVFAALLFRFRADLNSSITSIASGENCRVCVDVCDKKWKSIWLKWDKFYGKLWPAAFYCYQPEQILNNFMARFVAWTHVCGTNTPTKTNVFVSTSNRRKDLLPLRFNVRWWRVTVCVALAGRFVFFCFTFDKKCNSKWSSEKKFLFFIFLVQSVRVSVCREQI